MSKKVYTGADIEALLKAGKSSADIPSGAVLTPSAKDVLRDGLVTARGSSAAPAKASTEPILPDYEYHWTPGKDPKTPAEIEKFFNSPAIVTLKERMVDIGKRMWAREYTDGNGGNLTIRVGDNLVLCTPTLVSKGFMTVEHMCLVDMEGKQLAGIYKRTSECMTHLAIMKRQPKAKACCHAHPPHGTAFAVAGVQPQERRQLLGLREVTLEDRRQRFAFQRHDALVDLAALAVFEGDGELAVAEQGSGPLFVLGHAAQPESRGAVRDQQPDRTAALHLQRQEALQRQPVGHGELVAEALQGLRRHRLRPAGIGDEARVRDVDIDLIGRERRPEVPLLTRCERHGREGCAGARPVDRAQLRLAGAVRKDPLAREE